MTNETTPEPYTGPRAAARSWNASAARPCRRAPARPPHGVQLRGWFTGWTARGRRGGWVEEPGFRVLLTEPGERKAEVIRAIRTVTGLSLWNSRLLLDGAPVAVTEPDWLEAAQDAAGVLEAAGAHVTVLCDWCDRTVTRVAGPLDPASCKGPWPPETCRASCPPATDRVRPLLTD
ncbi:ribosomal protein L7/L12 [Streptomyces sp. ZAF1911]|uniref:ribosomal protein L7/L12 n=1 Tax=Streptomyces sp. ZAF1911 TaxID=2944129 RepID=UPI00237C3966|nr:ribosomal protein L7/L12 [Streptomyces sp. ZAF1911]MDD9375338.1 ribosomal protein L7/L12 [Streptomyces sp. ZAF1911]